MPQPNPNPTHPPPLPSPTQSLRHNLAREAAAHAATRERIADLEAALQEALAAYQALSVQLRTMTRQQQQAEALAGYQGMPDQLQAMKRQQQQLQHPGQQKSPRQQQRAQQQEQCPEPGQQQPAQPTQQTQQVALLLERLSRAEEGLQQRDACLEALQRANALLFSHAQAVGGDLRGYETELQRAGATLREVRLGRGWDRKGEGRGGEGHTLPEVWWRGYEAELQLAGTTLQEVRWGRGWAGTGRRGGAGREGGRNAGRVYTNALMSNLLLWASPPVLAAVTRVIHLGQPSGS